MLYRKKSVKCVMVMQLWFVSHSSRVYASALSLGYDLCRVSVHVLSVSS